MKIFLTILVLIFTKSAFGQVALDSAKLYHYFETMGMTTASSFGQFTRMILGRFLSSTGLAAAGVGIGLFTGAGLAGSLLLGGAVFILLLVGVLPFLSILGSMGGGGRGGGFGGGGFGGGGGSFGGGGASGSW